VGLVGDGYPYFIQKYGEALWDAADAANLKAVSSKLYASTRARVQDALDAEFFENRHLDAPRADQLTLRVAAALGGERFEIARLAAQFKGRNANAIQQSVNRLLKSNHIYRVSQGVYAYTAPLFGDFLRRQVPTPAIRSIARVLKRHPLATHPRKAVRVDFGWLHSDRTRRRLRRASSLGSWRCPHMVMASAKPRSALYSLAFCLLASTRLEVLEPCRTRSREIAGVRLGGDIYGSS
jgi:hypothetical protein